MAKRIPFGSPDSPYKTEKELIFAAVRTSLMDSDIPYVDILYQKGLPRAKAKKEANGAARKRRLREMEEAGLYNPALPTQYDGVAFDIISRTRELAALPRPGDLEEARMRETEMKTLKSGAEVVEKLASALAKVRENTPEPTPAPIEISHD